MEEERLEGARGIDNHMTSILRVNYAATPVAATTTRPASPASPQAGEVHTSREIEYQHFIVIKLMLF